MKAPLFTGRNRPLRSRFEAMTPLMSAARQPFGAELMMILVDAEADVDKREDTITGRRMR